MGTEIVTGAGDEAALTPEQELLVEAGKALIAARAAKIARRYPGMVEATDLQAAGALGLREAARSYDEARSSSFAHYAGSLIEYRMLDDLRRERLSLRARVEVAMERAAARISAHLTIDADLYADPAEEVREAARKGCADTLAAAFLAGALTAEQLTPEDELAEREEAARLAEVLREETAALPPTERLLLESLYERDQSLVEVARSAGVHVSTIQRREAQALRHLRKRLEARGFGR